MYPRLASAGFLITLATAAEATPSNKWRLQFSVGANSDGVITLKFHPKDGLPIVTETPIKNGTGGKRGGQGRGQKPQGTVAQGPVSHRA